jgi:hypothetical protein
MRQSFWITLLIAICLTHTITAAQSSLAVGDSPKFVEVQMRFCGAKARKPPLEKLYFRVSLRSLTSKQEWILMPSVLYSAPTQARSGAGISEIELLENRLRTIKFLRFHFRSLDKSRTFSR